MGWKRRYAVRRVGLGAVVAQIVVVADDVDPVLAAYVAKAQLARYWTGAIP